MKGNKFKDHMSIISSFDIKEENTEWPWGTQRFRASNCITGCNIFYCEQTSTCLIFFLKEDE